MRTRFFILAFALAGCGVGPYATGDGGMAQEDSSTVSMDAAVLCSEEYVEVSIDFPGVGVRRYCRPAVFIAVYGGFDCWLGEGRASGGGPYAGITVSGAFDWFGAANLGVPTTATTSFHLAALADDECPGGSEQCDYNGRACPYVVTQAPSTRGDIVEGHLVAPCALAGDDGLIGNATLVSASFHARLYEQQPLHVSGEPCRYPDGGMGYDERIDAGVRDM